SGRLPTPCPAVASSPGRDSCPREPGQLAGPVPGPPVGREHVGNFPDVAPRTALLRDYLGDRVDDPGERDAAGHERADALLVSGVVDGGGAAAGHSYFAGQGDGRERLLVQRLERPLVRGGPVDGGGRLGDALRPGHG